MDPQCLGHRHDFIDVRDCVHTAFSSRWRVVNHDHPQSGWVWHYRPFLVVIQIPQAPVSYAAPQPHHAGAAPEMAGQPCSTRHGGCFLQLLHVPAGRKSPGAFIDLTKAHAVSYPLARTRGRRYAARHQGSTEGGQRERVARGGGWISCTFSVLTLVEQALRRAPVDTATGALLEERFRILTPAPATPAAVSAAVAQVATHFCLARTHWVRFSCSDTPGPGVYCRPCGQEVDWL